MLKHRIFILGTFDSQLLTNDYLDKVILPYMKRHGLSKLLLIIDSATCHLTQEFKKRCGELNIFLKLVKPRMTPICSPADQSWFGWLKPEVVVCWRDW